MSIPLAHYAGASFNLIELLPLLAMGLGYAYRTHRLSERGKGVPLWRQLTFAAGLAAFALALFSPLGHINKELFSAHTIQHLLITDAAALLVVIGLTGPVLQPLLKLPVLGWTRWLSNPAVAFPLWLVNLYIWHLPFVYGAAIGSDLVHGLQHTLFFGLSAMLWMPLFGPLPKPPWFGDGAQFIYVVGFRFGGVILGNFLTWVGVALYEPYVEGAAGWGLNPVADQGVGGAIMGVENILFSLGLVSWLLLRFARHDEIAQDLVDYARDNEIALEKKRARRAVAAGRERELRLRLEREIEESGRVLVAPRPSVRGVATKA